MSVATLVYISTGSNIDPENNTIRAITSLKTQLSDCRVSTIYRSAAVGMQGPDFINAVVGGRIKAEPESVAEWLRDIEDQHGRVRTENKFVDRSLDLDLLLYGDLMTPALPHQDIIKQAYVLQPLFDIAPSYVHPKLKLTISDLRSRLIRQSPEKFTALTPVVIAHSTQEL